VIWINKPDQGPPILLIRGVQAARRLCDQYDAGSQDSQHWSFEPGLYNAKSVKRALQKTQHEKCAFCESKVSHVAYGDVEHFRPKKGYRQRRNDLLIQPGYYWLAYEWSNLLFCCQVCNQRFKGNYFPLLDVQKRARSHHDDIQNERPVFIQPALEDPSAFLEFREEYLSAKRGNRRGKLTIEVLGLNREALAERRRERLAALKRLIACRVLLAKRLAKDSDPEFNDELKRIDHHLMQLTKDSAEYSAMMRTALKSSLTI
jgi:uncharacterized protein (TIGR02646 family)